MADELPDHHPGQNIVTAPWAVLVVDDEMDVHDVTHLALKRRVWRKRPFQLTSCYRASEAREKLLADGVGKYQVVLVDVVMETSTAGLELCRFIRAECPASVRIILRTGQAGVAPEERVINDYDIDYYLTKTEGTPEKLFATIRSCLRSSQDIETLLAFSRQLQHFASALQTITSEADLAVLMGEGLKFLELKHQVHVAFVKSIAQQPQGPEETQSHELVLKGHELGLESGKMLSGKLLGADNVQVLLFAVRIEGSDQTVRGGFVIGAPQSTYATHALQNDLTMFMRNWTIAYGAVLLQQRVAHEMMLNERMYVERIEGIANMVTGVAHEINTPLGIATTANGMLVSLAEEIATAKPGPELDSLVADLKESAGLLSKNLDRASRLVRSFKQLSATQLSDERASSDIDGVIRDCLEAMSVETRKRKVLFRMNWPQEEKFPWIGYPGHLSQVIVNLVQNALRYAYRGEEGGVIDLRLVGKGDTYEIEFEDYGAGVKPDILPRMFEPFVTSGRDVGGTGLGLAISHNIMSNLLKGRITCTTALGKGTKFTLVVPRVVPT